MDSNNHRGGDGVDEVDGLPKEQILDEDEIQLIGDLGSDFDDPDELWTERAGYWTHGAAVARPSKQVCLLLRMRQLWGQLHVPGRQSRLDGAMTATDAHWTVLAATVLGPFDQRAPIGSSSAACSAAGLADVREHSEPSLDPSSVSGLEPTGTARTTQDGEEPKS
ncbi:MAG: hypothetical protein V4508_08840 [Pseudomonadota bacterium]